MKIQITHGPAMDGWTALAPNDAVDGLPSTAPIERIFVSDLLSLTPDEIELGLVLESWHASDTVSTKTLLGFTVSRNQSGLIYSIARPLGWGVACPYRSSLLALDKWPVPKSTDADGLVGGIARAIKKNKK